MTTQGFLEALLGMIDQTWLRVFSWQETRILIGRLTSSSDLGDLRHRARCGRWNDTAHPLVLTFQKTFAHFSSGSGCRLVRPRAAVGVPVFCEAL
ncbi:hypothetical protein BJ912DRAFT_385774 [Pholiota molesta]|nr:hypothetical protein BJ912DRAFT_385774 [Pholiota molesta]